MISYPTVVSKYSPDESERQRIDSVLKKCTEFVRNYCKEKGIEADPVIVGSVAKGTNLRDGDIDIFIRFERTYRKQEMERIGMEIGHKLLNNGQEKYAEHPYVMGHLEGIKIDVVPCYRISEKEKKVSSVDRTPLHTDYVLNNLKENQKNDVLLLKVFMKAIGVYGSEVRTSGFSGYICELLTINFGTFDNVLSMFAALTGRLVIPGTQAVRDRFSGPVVIIDPVDDTRNAAAAVSLESLSKVKVAAKEFLRKPSDFFFELEKEWPTPEYEDRGTCIRIFEVPRPELTDDVIYTQAVRFKNILWGIYDRYELLPVSWEIYVDDEIINILVESRRDHVPLLNVHAGPPVDSRNVKDFIDKWKNAEKYRGPYIKGDRLYVDFRNEPAGIEELVRRELKTSNIGVHINRYRNRVKIIDPETEKRRMKVLDKFYSKNLF